MKHLLIVAYFIFLACFAVNIPTSAIFVSNESGSNIEANCGNESSNACSSLMKGYDQSTSIDGGDRHVQIYGGVEISGKMELSNGGVYYTYGILSESNKPKVTGDDTFCIEGESDTSWLCIFLHFLKLI
jgi:hypothetical protein